METASRAKRSNAMAWMLVMLLLVATSISHTYIIMRMGRAELTTRMVTQDALIADYKREITNLQATNAQLTSALTAAQRTINDYLTTKSLPEADGKLIPAPAVEDELNTGGKTKSTKSNK